MENYHFTNVDTKSGWGVGGGGGEGHVIASGGTTHIVVEKYSRFKCCKLAKVVLLDNKSLKILYTERIKSLTNI